MFICIHKLVVQEYFPLRVEDFTSTVRHKMITRVGSVHILAGKVFKCVRKLKIRSVKANINPTRATHGLKVGYVIAQVAGRFASAVFGLIPKVQIRWP